MNRKTKWSHRLLALALAAVMCCSVFPVGAFAETPLPQESTVATEEQQGRPMPATPTPEQLPRKAQHQPRMSLLKKTSLTPLTVKSSTRICRTPPQAPTSAATVCQ